MGDINDHAVLPHRLTFNHRYVANIYKGGSKEAYCVYINLCYGEGRKLWQEITKRSHPAFNLVGINGLDWACDMAPWNYPALNKNSSPCLGGAQNYLKTLTDTIVPAVEESLELKPHKRILCGYSLAGMFAIWSLYNTTLFDMVGSISGSVWLPPFNEFIFTHALLKTPERIYLSLGDREKLSTIPLLASVEERTLKLQQHYQELGINCAYELNPGGHELNPEWRTAKGIIALCSKHPKLFEHLQK